MPASASAEIPAARQTLQIIMTKKVNDYFEKLPEEKVSTCWFPELLSENAKLTDFSLFIPKV